MGTNDESAKTNRLDSSNGKFSVTSHKVTILIPAQKLKNKVVRLLSRVTAFLTYAPPSPTLSLLTVVQAEVLRQEQDGHDTEPNFFQGIHQVRMTAYLIPFFLTLFILAFSNFSTTTSTAPWASQKTQARYDENPSFTCTIYHSTASCRDYHFQNPPTTSIHPATPSCNAARRRCSVCEG
jgi:hypothetical protein